MKKILSVIALCACVLAGGAAPVVSVASMKEAPAAGDSDEGTLTVVLEEDFSLMTEGSEDAPAAAIIEDDDLSVPASLTHMPGWQGYNLHQAGGMLNVALDSKGMESGALNTPRVDVSAAGGAFTVRFRARSTEQGEDKVYVVSKLTPSDYVSKEVKITEQWNDYAVMFENGSASSYVMFTTWLEGMLIDDIRLEVLVPYVAAPKNLSFSNYTVTGFDAAWAPVEGATGYLLNIFTKDASGSHVYYRENMPVEGTSFEVRELPSSESYYYFTVRATDGVHNSPESAEMAVEGLLLPELQPETNVTETGFTANWKPVDHAQSYQFIATREHTAAEAGEYFLMDENFDGITETSTSTYDYTSIPELPGWTIASAKYVPGAVGVNSANGMYGEDAWIQSAVYDFSKNNGDVHVRLRVYCTYRTSNKYKSTVYLGMHTYDPSIDRFRMVERREYKDVGADGIVIDEVLKGGGQRSLLMLEPDGYADMFIDEISVSQELEEGDVVETTAVSRSVTEPTLDVTGLKLLPGDRVCYVVRAVGRNSGDTRTIYSDYTQRRYVALPQAGVETITGADDAPLITVYNLQGILLLKDASRGELNSLPCGLYIVNGRKLLLRD